MRINGVNSDYKWAGEGVLPQFTTLEDGTKTGLPGELYMKLFICPYDKPTSLEDQKAEPHRCEGTNGDGCPEDGTANGHAMVHLNQSSGIELVTDNDTRIGLDQSGNIELQPQGAGKVTVDGKTNLNGATEVNGTFKVKNTGGTTMINVTSTQITLTTAGGAQVILKSNGAIDLTPKAGQKVTVNGNMKLTGTLELANGTIL